MWRTNGATSVFVYPALGSSTGPLNEAPIATISGSNTGLFPQGIALDSSHNIYVADDGADSVFVYSSLGSSTGVNEAPIATISGSNTGLLSPDGIALDSSGKIYVADYYADSVFVYSALGSSTGTLNEAPSATISTTMTTGLSAPQGIALDSSGKIYVADDGTLRRVGTPSVFVYAAGSNGNAAPIATISGSATGLIQPIGIALDSSRKIYVADESAASVFVYSAWEAAPAMSRPNRHHHRAHTGLAPSRHRAGFQRQHLCDGRHCGPRACLSIRREATATPPPPTPSAGAAPS